MRIHTLTYVQANRAHTYLGLREKEYHVSGDLKDIYPDFVMMATAFGVKARRVSKPEELRPAIKVPNTFQSARYEMPYLLLAAFDCLAFMPGELSLGLFLQEMLAMEGPYLLDIMVPHIQHVLPMIPGGGSFQEVITTGDGLDTY
jgi:acetolactate synthase-1/2/3 large subunit